MPAGTIQPREMVAGARFFGSIGVAAGTLQELSMTNLNVSEDGRSRDRVDGEEQLLESLRALWIPHQRRDLEVRYEAGKLLNEKLGPPKRRQAYGMGTVQLISTELEIDVSTISRIRRFADMFDSFEDFGNKHPDVRNWTAVRTLLSKAGRDPEEPADARALWAARRSARSIVKALGRDFDRNHPTTNDLKAELTELFQLAEQRLGFSLPTDTGT